MKLIELQAVMALIVSYNHEIRNPLTIAIGNASMCLKSNEEERIKRIEKIEDALHRIEEIVDKLQKIGEKVEIEYELYAVNRKMLKL
jgi:signal transduction histidine kinase